MPLKTRAQLQAELEELRVLNEHAWKSYEFERRLVAILQRRERELLARLSRFEHSLEHQQ